MKEITELDVIYDVAKSLGLDLPKKATLGSVRLEILAAIDQLEKERECHLKRYNSAVRLGKRYRAKSFTARKRDLTFGTI